MKLSELFGIARSRSPFYRNLYAGITVNDDCIRLDQLPVVDQREFWSANTIQNNRLLTGPLADGVVFKSGGTTGQPKFSFFSNDEWELFCAAFGRGLDRGGLRHGDRVANLFYAGELYASFLFITKSIELAGAGAVCFPLTGAADPSMIADTVRDFKIDTLAGVPTTLMTLAEYLRTQELSLPSVRRILFGGESMYADQRAELGRRFPGVMISSVGYASVDAGLLGYADPQCAVDEHRVFGEETILEIVDDDTGVVIQEAGRAGRVLLTNLTRALMPVIRYPVGDRAMWVEPGDTVNRKFQLCGRSDEAARVGPVSLYYDDLRSLPGFSGGFQMNLDHEAGKDRLTLSVVSLGQFEPDKLKESVYEARPLLRQAVENGMIHPLSILLVRPHDLVVNPRTGKLRRVLDARF